MLPVYVYDSPLLHISDFLANRLMIRLSHEIYIYALWENGISMYNSVFANTCVHVCVDVCLQSIPNHNIIL